MHRTLVIFKNLARQKVERKTAAKVHYIVIIIIIVDRAAIIGRVVTVSYWGCFLINDRAGHGEEKVINFGLGDFYGDDNIFALLKNTPSLLVLQ